MGSQSFLQPRPGFSGVGATKQIDLRDVIGNYPNFPKDGILFRDINPVFRNINALNYIAEEFHHAFGSAKIDAVAGIESRGFVVATALAMKFGTGMIMIRKAGKLPGKTLKKSYDIEYGSAVMELQNDAITKGQNVLVADDLVATGGTAIAASQLIKEVGGRVAGFAFVIELGGLKGADRLRKLGYEVQSLVVYD
jgi:adenine phosphoribosyltransferase